MNDRSLLLLVVLVYLTGVLLCVFSPNGPYLLSFSTLCTSLFESSVQRTDSTHWFSFFFIRLLQFFSLSWNKENTFSGGPLIQPEAFPRDVRIERLGCLSTDLIFGILNQGRSPAQFCHSWRWRTAFCSAFLFSHSSLQSPFFLLVIYFGWVFQYTHVCSTLGHLKGRRQEKETRRTLTSQWGSSGQSLYLTVEQARCACLAFQKNLRPGREKNTELHGSWKES